VSGVLPNPVNFSREGRGFMFESIQTTFPEILVRILAAGLIGGLIGYEWRVYYKALCAAGMVLIAIGIATFMLLAEHLNQTDPGSISRTLQGLLSGIGFLGGAVIFKSGSDIRGIKAAAAVWITGAIGLAIGTSFWWLGITVGAVTIVVLFVSDRFPNPVRAMKQENGIVSNESAGHWNEDAEK
jgi:putative Mg2+ transporter-C (MgtC) family protein